MKKVISWILLVLWLGVIFFLSSMGGKSSNGTSYKITDVIVSVVDNDNKSDNTRETVNYIVRKGAHFTEYLILGVLTLNVLNLYSISNKKKLIFGLVFCLLYAGSDEYHQMYIADRSPMLKDVLIDFSGAVIGIFIYNKIKK